MSQPAPHAHPALHVEIQDVDSGTCQEVRSPAGDGASSSSSGYSTPLPRRLGVAGASPANSGATPSGASQASQGSAERRFQISLNDGGASSGDDLMHPPPLNSLNVRGPGHRRAVSEGSASSGSGSGFEIPVGVLQSPFGSGSFGRIGSPYVSGSASDSEDFYGSGSDSEDSFSSVSSTQSARPSSMFSFDDGDDDDGQKPPLARAGTVGHVLMAPSPRTNSRPQSPRSPSPRIKSKPRLTRAKSHRPLRMTDRTLDNNLNSPTPPRLARSSTIETAKVRVEKDSSGHKRVNQYRVLETIGRGVFGKVKLVQDTKDDQFYAMKIMSKSELRARNRVFTANADGWEAVRREVAIMKRLQHPHIVRLYEVIDDDAADKLYMIMDYVENGPCMPSSLENEPLDEDRARNYFRDLIAGLEYLHSQQVIHRDIKPENLLLTADDRIKITDFGVSSKFTDNNDRVGDTAGSLAFMAPEMCAGRGEFSGRAADVWSAGVTLYMFIYGCVPFIASSAHNMHDIISQEPLTFPEDPAIDASLADLFEHLLAKDPEKRIAIDAIKKHPWVTQGGAEPMPDLRFQEDVRQTLTSDDMSHALVIISKLKVRASRAKRRLRQRRAKKVKSATLTTEAALAASAAPSAGSRRSRQGKGSGSGDDDGAN